MIPYLMLHSSLLHYLLLHYTQPARDVLGRSPKGPNVWDLQGTLRGLLGEQQKNWWFDWKSVFLDAIVFVLHICYYFLLEKQIFESSKWGRPRDVYGTQLRDVSGTEWWDVLGTSAGRRWYMLFKFNSKTYSTYFDKLLKWIVVVKNSVNSIVI